MHPVNLSPEYVNRIRYIYITTKTVREAACPLKSAVFIAEQAA